jgi:hypothetical protein
MSEESIPQDVADRMMVKCGRRCCICRRFRPTKLQVHHIVERSQGGGHEEDNLIVTCLSCHTDVHTKVPFARRFTVEELKGHRNAVIKMVSEGVLPTSDEDDTDTVVAAVLGQMRAHPISGLPLMPEAVSLLLAAANAQGTDQGSIIVSFNFEGYVIQAGSETIRGIGDARSQAKYKRALKQLSSCGVIDATDYRGEIFEVTDEGYLLADEIMSRSEEGSS